MAGFPTSGHIIMRILEVNQMTLGKMNTSAEQLPYTNPVAKDPNWILKCGLPYIQLELLNDWRLTRLFSFLDIEAALLINGNIWA